MSSIVIDSDGLIKLAKAGLLEPLTRRHACWIAEAVYREVVQQGLRAGYSDARAVQDLLDRGMVKRRHKTPALRLPPDWPTHVLGAGEEATYRAFKVGRHAAILTDDRAFLRYLERGGAPYVTPAAALVRLYETHTLSVRGAQEGLERLRPLIRPDAYWAARASLERKT